MSVGSIKVLLLQAAEESRTSCFLREFWIVRHFQTFQRCVNVMTSSVGLFTLRAMALPGTGITVVETSVKFEKGDSDGDGRCLRGGAEDSGA